MLLTNNKDNVMTKNRTKFAVIAAIGLSLSSGLSQTALMTMDSADSLIVSRPAISVATCLQVAAVAHRQDGFHIISQDRSTTKVPNHSLSEFLQKISTEDLIKFLGHGSYLVVSKWSDGEFELQEKGRLMGGWDGTGSDLLKNAFVGTLTATSSLIKTNPELVPNLVGPFSKIADAWMMTNQLAATAGPYIWAAGTYTMYVGVGGAVGVGLYYGVPRAYNAYQRSYNPTLKQQNEHLVQQLRLNYTACLVRNPLAEDTEGTSEIPFACVGHFNKLKMVTDAMKMSEATQLVENEHNVQQLRLNYSTCILTHPIAEGPGAISPACIGHFNKFKKVADAMKMREDTTQS